MKLFKNFKTKKQLRKENIELLETVMGLIREKSIAATFDRKPLENSEYGFTTNRKYRMKADGTWERNGE